MISITTNCSEKKLETFNDISQLIVHCAVMPSAAKLSAVKLHHLQHLYLFIEIQINDIDNFALTETFSANICNICIASIVYVLSF